MYSLDNRIDLEKKDNLLEILNGIRETRANILSKYGASSKEELLMLISKSRILYRDASIDLYRLDILDEMEKCVLETLEKLERPNVLYGIFDVIRRFNLFRRTSVKEAMT